jgi:hypothetical protein
LEYTHSINLEERSEECAHQSQASPTQVDRLVLYKWDFLNARKRVKPERQRFVTGKLRLEARSVNVRGALRMCYYTLLEHMGSQQAIRMYVVVNRVMMAVSCDRAGDSFPSGVCSSSVFAKES